MRDSEELAAPACPQCGSARVVAILYGLVIPTGEQWAKLDEIVFGGCVISEDSPKWACLICRHRFGLLVAHHLDD